MLSETAITAFAPNILRHARKFSNIGDPEDLAQGALERIWKSRAGYEARSGAKASSWMLTVAHNFFMDVGRGRKQVFVELPEIPAPAPQEPAARLRETLALMQKTPEGRARLAFVLDGALVTDGVKGSKGGTISRYCRELKQL